MNPPESYCQNIRSASTPLTDPDAKIRQPRRGKDSASAASSASSRQSGRAARRPLAKPLSGARIYGPKTPVSVRLTYYGGSEPWVEVDYAQGRFWVLGTGSVLDLINRVIAGGFPITESRARKKRGRGWVA